MLVARCFSVIRKIKNNTVAPKDILINSIADVIREYLIVDLCLAIIMYAKLIR